MHATKICILDGGNVNPGDLSFAPIASLGQLSVYDRPVMDNPQEIIRRIGNAEVVISDRTPLPRIVLETCPNLKLITLFSTGYNHIDLQAAKSLGIPVCNNPGYGTTTVAQHTIALLLALCNRVTERSTDVHNGRWTKDGNSCFYDYPMLELSGKTMGILGFGRIGRKTASIARSLGMDIIACSASECDAGRALGRYVDFKTLLHESDVLSLHCPLFPETEGMINSNTISLMKDGALLINTARGKLVEDAALAEALYRGKLAGAALDVVSTEPITPDNPLLHAPNCIITPHCAWTSREARSRIIDTTAACITAWQEGRLLHEVNP